MKKDLDENISLINQILRENGLTQLQLAETLGMHKQYINMVLNGNRNISDNFMKKLREHFPSYFPDLRMLKIKYCPHIRIPYCRFIDTKSSDTVIFDKQLIQTPVNSDSCVIVTVDADYKPMYLKGDKVILDTSYKEFINDGIFVFTYGNNCYVRKISILPDKIKCIPINEDEDTFYIYSLDDKTVILGLIVPNIRL